MEGCLLPPEIIVYISSFLDIVAQSRLKQACRTFNDIVIVDMGGKGSDQLREMWTKHCKCFDFTAWWSIFVFCSNEENFPFLKLCLHSNVFKEEPYRSSALYTLGARLSQCGRQGNVRLAQVFLQHHPITTFESKRWWKTAYVEACHHMQSDFVEFWLRANLLTKEEFVIVESYFTYVD